ncbi:MAG: iron-containing alcohol dehydrogenase, partial [Acidobacteriaceae bacterium]|nr:iron-containing alcohol dehydrogenase [Acidobacteriaceae bacterium]
YDGGAALQHTIPQHLPGGRTLVMRFDFATVGRILFGVGIVSELPKIASELGRRPLVITGRTTARAAPAVNALEPAKLDALTFSVEGEPTLDIVRSGAKLAREQRRDLLIGLGGGSAIDTAKAIAALATNSGEPLDYLEVIGRAQPLENAPLPFIAVPTTAGTGAEVTRNAVLGSPEHKVKASLRSPMMLAKVALVDPELTLDLPAAATASTGLDALTQLIEAYVSSRANRFTDLFCVEGMQRVKASLVEAFNNGAKRSARESMSFASLLSGLALANAGLGVVHGFAAPLGGMLNAPHGALCAAVLPQGVLVNVQALHDRAPSHEGLRRYSQAARILTGNQQADAADLSRWLSDLVLQLNIPPLRHHGLTGVQIPALIERVATASSTKSNPIPLTREELTEIAERAL